MNDIIDRTKFTLMNSCGRTPQKYTICVCKDKRGMYPCCVRKVTNDGDMILSEKDIEAQNRGAIFIPENETFTVYDGKKYDIGTGKTYLVLDKDHKLVETDKEGAVKETVKVRYMMNKDEAEWECIKNCSLIAMSQQQKNANGESVIDGGKHRYGKAILYVKYTNEDSTRRVSRTEKINKAYNYIFTEKTERGRDGLAQRSLLLSRNMDYATEQDIEDFLLLEASKNPDRVISTYEDESAQYKLLVLTAVNRGVITKDTQTGQFVYGATNLGTSVDSVVTFLKDDRYIAMYDSIKKETFREYNIKTKK